MSQIEILAPVGNYSMLEAGIAAGASCFYLALDDFGARAYAENFTIENIKEVIDYIHLFDKKVFVTMNILIKDREMPKAIYYVEKLYEYGVDALIIQDLGLFSIIKDKVPGMDLHASTQMAVRDYYGAKYLAKLGFDRIVIARETPIEEIRKITSLDVEVEVFVHGSLCVSYSGECLMSSYFGGRSANRGRCAGPCRQKYELISDDKSLGNDYYLNMKDLNVIENLDDLIDIGVDCLKIEGRMKTPEYVYTSVINYRQKILDNTYKKEELIDSSNRGYTRGFIFDQKEDYIGLKDDKKHRSLGKISKEKSYKYFISNSDLSIGDNLEITTDRGKKLPFTTKRSYKKADKIILEKYKDAMVDSDVLLLNSTEITKSLEDALDSYKNLYIDIDFKAEIGKNPEITLEYKDKKIKYIHDLICEEAKNISITDEDVKVSLSKLNDEIFTASKINTHIEEGIFIRKKDINECRRKAVDLLKQEILKDYHRNTIDIKLPVLENKNISKIEKNIELLTNKVNPNLLSDFDNIYLRAYDEKYKDFNLYFYLDSHDDYKIDELISYLQKYNYKGVICNNYRDLNFISDFNKNNIGIRIGRYLNIFNSYTSDFYSDFAEMICLSSESDLDFINANSSRMRTEALVYGRIELMNMRHCPFSTIKKCCLSGCSTCSFNKGEMKSVDGSYMKVIRYGDYSKIYPDKTDIFDISKLSKDTSLLYSIMDDQDLINLNKAKVRDSYTKGVI
ncbi:U32 family peptidase [uncultured Anaerococcus sp.]|uniref:peptidase U32 family protein n=1 Tax=uncultured Anaerococcus sp. TaxID=293428 RepID=UPI002630EAC7|nr:U32 family peptidase [uncultured Anaerococcus sp.]